MANPKQNKTGPARHPTPVTRPIPPTPEPEQPSTPEPEQEGPKGSVIMIEQSLLESLQRSNREAVIQAEVEKAKAEDLRGQVDTLEKELSDRSQQIGLTVAEEKKLFEMCAEITFDRSRSGDSFVIKLRGRRSHTSGKIGRFSTLQELAEALRKRK